MSKDWKKSIAIIEEIDVLYSDKNRFVVGECNCSRCVSERISEKSSAMFFNLYDYFPPTLNLWHYSDSNILKLMKIVYDSERVKESTEQMKFHIFRAAAEKNISREKRIPKDKVVICGDCGVLLNDSKCFHMDGRPICAYCAKIYNQCNECKQFCLDDNFVKIKYINEKGKTDTVTVCKHCYDSYIGCDFCGNMHKKKLSSMIEVPPHVGKRPICKYCRENKIHNCSDCGNLVYVGNSSSFENPMGELVFRVPEELDAREPEPREDNKRPILCYDCIAYQKPINAWNFKPKPIFCCDESEEQSKKSVHTLFYGVELEIEKLEGCQTTNTTMATKMRGMFPKRHLYAVSDGSLASGFEFVTQPFTWKHLMSRKKLWMAFFQELEKYKFGTGPRAGMHVHMSKGAFTTLHLYKFIQFLYKDSVRSFLSEIAQRNIRDNMFCRFDAIDVENVKAVAKRKDNICEDKHHTAINLENEATIETRIFRMPASYEEFMKNLEFMDALYHYSMNTSLKNLVILDFIKYITEGKKIDKYSNLIMFIKNNDNILNRYSTIKSKLV